MGGSMRRLVRGALILGLLVAALGPASSWVADSARAEALPPGNSAALAATIAVEAAVAPESLAPAPHFGFNSVLDQTTTTLCFTVGSTCRVNLSTVGLPTSGGPVVEIGPVEVGSCPSLTTNNCVQFTLQATGFLVQGIIGPAQPFLIPGDIPTLRIPVVDAFQNVSFREVQCGAVDGAGTATCNLTISDPVFPQTGGFAEVRVARNLSPFLPPVANIPPPPLEFIPQAPPPPLLPPGPPVPPLQGAAQMGGPSAPARYPAVPVIPEADSVLLLVGGLMAVGAFAWLRRRRAE